jgi:hypothetical protein
MVEGEVIYGGESQTNNIVHSVAHRRLDSFAVQPLFPCMFGLCGPYWNKLGGWMGRMMVASTISWAFTVAHMNYLPFLL